MPVTFQLVNDANVIKKLDVLDQVLRRSIVREAMRAGANVILPQVRNETDRFKYRWPLPPGRSKGDLRRGLKVRAIKRTRKTIGVSLVSTLKNNAGTERSLYYGAFVNWGHKIGRRPGKGQVDNRKKVKPVPYMTDAFKKRHRQAIKVATDIIIQGVEREWKRGWSGK